jgi:DNA repair exonuclease SbcCD ATPase subunit
MSKGKGKAIDYLTEDPPIPSQKYALISIVGPHMRQKCDVWGLKIRGVADSLETAKTLTKRIMKLDKDYDIYTVDIGKFFPLAVEPYDVANVEYENQQLNDLIKNYLENKEKANEHWHHRKQEMIKEAIREGKVDGQKELADKKEHPISVLQRIKNFEDKIKEESERLESMKEDLKLSKEKYESYTEEERELANKELITAIEHNVEPKVPEEKSLTIEEIRNEIMTELTSESQNIEDTILNLKKLEDEIREVESILSSVNKETSPSVFSTLNNQLNNLRESHDKLKYKLNESDDINSYINSNYVEGKHDSLFQ